MFKKSLFIAALAISSSVFALEQGPCANFAKAAAIRVYKASVGTVQGSDGIQYEIKKKLQAKLPFYNYIVSISDNNEDGEFWSVDYFVMTKKVKNSCKVLKVKEEVSDSQSEEEGSLEISAYTDFDYNDFDEPVAIDVNLDFVENSGKYIDFRVFTDDGTYPSICYKGSQASVKKIINSILDVTTGDSFILSSKVSFVGEKIVHEGTYTEGSGDHDFSLNFEISKCQ